MSGTDLLPAKADLEILSLPPRVEALRGKVVGPGTILHGPGIISQALAMFHKHTNTYLSRHLKLFRSPNQRDTLHLAKHSSFMETTSLGQLAIQGSFNTVFGSQLLIRPALTCPITHPLRSIPRHVTACVTLSSLSLVCLPASPAVSQAAKRGLEIVVFHPHSLQ